MYPRAFGVQQVTVHFFSSRCICIMGAVSKRCHSCAHDGTRHRYVFLRPQDSASGLSAGGSSGMHCYRMSRLQSIKKPATCMREPSCEAMRSRSLRPPPYPQYSRSPSDWNPGCFRHGTSWGILGVGAMIRLASRARSTRTPVIRGGYPNAKKRMRYRYYVA